MKTQKKDNKKPLIKKIDKHLDSYLQEDLFREKIEKANHVLKTVGLPKTMR